MSIRKLTRASAAAIIVFSAVISLSLNIERAAEAQDFKFLLWQKAVAKKVTSVQRYPRLAVAKNIEGQAQVRIKVLPNGTIDGYEVIKGTGHEVLDREIKKIINRINPLDAVPGDKSEYFLTVPLNWSLQ